MKITHFLFFFYSDSALYMNYRVTPSYIDGFKNAGRKAFYTLKKKRPSSDVKVSNFAGAAIDETKYLHGNTSMEGAIVSLAEDFCGSNHVPTITGIGAFGTRFVQDSAAARYIFIKTNNYMEELFKKADDQNLVEQQFEGETIEPIFHVPTIPLLIVNGAVGVGVGFKSVILPRSVKNVFTMVRDKIAKKKISDKLFVPYWKGFTGEVKKLEDNKWQVSGVMEVDSKDPRKVIITEVPITYDLVHYTNVLKKAKEKGIIDKYLDYSEDDIFKFEVKLNPNYMNCSKDELMKHLGLVDTITEILTCIDENNAIAEPESVKEIFEEYYKIKIKFLKKRITSEIKRLQDELDYNQEVYKFIMDVNKGNINIKLNKKDVEAKMKELKYKFTEKLIALPIYSLTKDKAAEAKQKVADKKVELEEMKKETPENVWLKDLDALEAKLKKEGRYV